MSKYISVCKESLENIPFVKSSTERCKARIDYMMEKEPRERTVDFIHVYSFPIVDSRKQNVYACSLRMLQEMQKCDRLPQNFFVTATFTASKFFFYVPSDCEDTAVIDATYSTKQIVSAKCFLDFCGSQKDLMAIRTRGDEQKCGFIHYFEVPRNTFNAEYITKKITKMIEYAEDNFIIDRYSSYEFTIDYKLLKFHVDALNTIIKEVIDMAILVARAVEARKKIEKNLKSTQSRKKKETSLKMLASSPTSEEFIDLLTKVRLGLNYMARLNPYVNYPNIPELLHHLIAPFSLITAFCGLDIVKTIQHPHLSNKAVWLIENCFTTNELAYWRTLGECWNKPRGDHPCTVDADDFYEPKFEFTYDNNDILYCRPLTTVESSSDDYSPHNYSSAIVLSEFHAPDYSDLSLYPGQFVSIAEKDGTNFMVVDSKGNQGFVPTKKLYTIDFRCEDDDIYLLAKECTTSRYVNGSKIYLSKRFNSIHPDFLCKNEQTENKWSFDHAEEQKVEVESSWDHNTDSNPLTPPNNSSDKISTSSGSHLKSTSISSCISSTKSTSKEEEHHQFESKSSTTSSHSYHPISSPTDDGVKLDESISVKASSCSFRSSKSTSHTRTHTVEEKCRKSSSKKSKRSWCHWCCRGASSTDLDTTGSIRTRSSLNRKSTSKLDEDSKTEKLFKTSSPSETSSKSTKKTSSLSSSASCISRTASKESPCPTYSKPEYNCSTKTPVQHETPIKQEICQETISESKPKTESSANKQAISLCWEKTTLDQDDLIKIEGMSLFRVRIKLINEDGTTCDLGSSAGQATLFVKQPTDDSCKSTPKITIISADKSKDYSRDRSNTDSRLSSQRCVYDSTNLSRRHSNRSSSSKDSYSIDSKVLHKDKSSESTYVSKSFPCKHSKQPSRSSLYNDTGVTICCDSHFKDRIQRTASIKQKPLDVYGKSDEFQIPEPPYECAREKWAGIQQEKNKKTEAVISDEIYRILRKYIPELKLSGSNTDEPVTSDKPMISEETLNEIYEKHICHGCGGLNESEKFPPQKTHDRKSSCSSRKATESSQKSQYACDGSSNSESHLNTTDHRDSKDSENETAKLASFREYLRNMMKETSSDINLSRTIGDVSGTSGEILTGLRRFIDSKSQSSDYSCPLSLGHKSSSSKSSNQSQTKSSSKSQSSDYSCPLSLGHKSSSSKSSNQSQTKSSSNITTEAGKVTPTTEVVTTTPVPATSVSTEPKVEAVPKEPETAMSVTPKVETTATPEVSTEVPKSETTSAPAVSTSSTVPNVSETSSTTIPEVATSSVSKPEPVTTETATASSVAPAITEATPVISTETTSTSVTTPPVDKSDKSVTESTETTATTLSDPSVHVPTPDSNVSLNIETDVSSNNAVDKVSVDSVVVAPGTTETEPKPSENLTESTINTESTLTTPPSTSVSLENTTSIIEANLTASSEPAISTTDSVLPNTSVETQ